MRQNRHWGRRLAALALSAALTGSAAPALAAGDYWDVDRLDWYYDRWIDNGAEAWYREATAYALDNSLILPFGGALRAARCLIGASLWPYSAAWRALTGPRWSRRGNLPM